MRKMSIQELMHKEAISPYDDLIKIVIGLLRLQKMFEILKES